MSTALRPYFELTRAVRTGHLSAFHQVVANNEHMFKLDKTYILISRLRSNVIKTGLRNINIAYSRISLADVCEKLRLDSVESAEFIVAKAIRDGVIDATINHKGSYLEPKESIDVYSTEQPAEMFHRKTEFCLKLHNDAVKSMRFPPEVLKATTRKSRFDSDDDDDDDMETTKKNDEKKNDEKKSDTKK
mmetsp:Transcript_6535/g.10095  ORF Transcript_6535/g.10095 Transcript_6535/m.10095 type:complete len:189 (-) Transcript_6535:27-593(-)